MRYQTKGNRQSDDTLRDNHVARKTDEWHVLRSNHWRFNQQIKSAFEDDAHRAAGVHQGPRYIVGCNF